MTEIQGNDPHAWLRDDNWRQVMKDPSVLKPEIRAFLETENERFETALADTADLQETLFQEMTGRIREDDSSVPAKDGGYFYLRRFETGRDYALHCRRTGGEDGPETVFLDENALAEGLAYLRIGQVRHSPDHRYLAYSVDDTGSEFYRIRIIDTQNGTMLDDDIVNASGGFAWDKGSATLFWTELNDNHRPCKVYAHALGAAADRLVYEETDPGFFLGVGKTGSGDYIIIDSHDHTTSEVRYVPADTPTADPVVIAPRDTGVEYNVLHHGDRFLILTNADGAEDFKIVETPVTAPERSNWRDMVPHTAGNLIHSHLVHAGNMARLERVNALPRIVISNLSTGGEHEISFEEEAFELGITPPLEFETGTLRFTYSSPTTPLSIFDYDMTARTRVVKKVQEVPSGHDPARYVTRRIEAPSHDGEMVPITLVYGKDTPLDGSAPCLLYGYGSYGHTMPAGFSTNRLSLVDRGFVYAIAHIRGGMEKGYLWYKNGKLKNKINTFLDFVAAGDALCNAGYTSRGRIVGHGGSAGGMLMGAVANLRPKLFLGIVADVPFVDVLNTMMDDTLPLTPPEWPEWGNPLESKSVHDFIASYSPYDNVVTQAYPHILATGGLTDPRVTYWEPAKWVARLRELKIDDNLLLLKTNMDAGHGGKSGRFEFLREIAEMYAFILKIADKA